MYQTKWTYFLYSIALFHHKKYKTPKLKAALLLTSILCAGFAYAQQPILFHHLSMENGLSQNSVMAIAQDQNQLLWFGTRNGLNRYDGYRFKVYTSSENPNSISNDVINCILTNSNGSIVVGTENGLNFYDEKKDHFLRVNKKSALNTLSNNSIECLYEDPQKNLWVGTLDGLNLMVDAKRHLFKKFYFAKNEGELKLNTILSIFKDRYQNLWIGTEGGLIRMYTSKGNYHFEVFKYNTNTAKSISSNYVRSITCDSAKNLWFGTDKGLNLFHYVDKSFTRFQKVESDQQSLINNDIRKLMCDRTGKIWIGTQEGISILDPSSKKFSNYKHDPEVKSSLSQNSTHSLFQDRAGSIYIGTYYKGINVRYPYATNFKTYINSQSKSSISSNIVSAIVADKDDNLWVGTEGGGLNHYNRKQHTFTRYLADPNNPTALSSNLIKTLYLCKNGKLMVGTHRGGLFAFDPLNQKFQKIINVKDTNNTPGTAEVLAITADSFGTLWVGSKNGLSTLSMVNNTYPTRTSKSLLEKRLKNKFIQVLFEDQSKNLWIGTIAGLFTYMPQSGKLNSYFKKADSTSLQSDRINCIIQTKNGNICIGTYLGGLSIFNPKTNQFKTYTQKNGLPNNNILGIIEDDQHNLWLSTDKGISKMDLVNHKFNNYTKSDGLSGNDFNFRSFFKDQHNELFFGGYDGLTSFYANQIEVNHYKAPIILTGLKLFNETVQVNASNHVLDVDIKIAKKIVLKHTDDSFSLEFALLNYIKPEKNQYSYKLIGYNKTWINSNVPSASYANLVPGNYTFVVKGVNNDGVKGTMAASIEVVILPPFWATWWAYLFYFLFFAGILFIIIRHIFVQERLKRTEDLQRMKLNFFTYIAHEIRTPLTLIIGPLENLLNRSYNNPELHKQVVPIKHNADRLIRLVTELLDFRKAETHHLKLHISEENIISFINEIFISFSHVAQSKNIDYRFNYDNEQINLFFDKIQLEKVLFNLLSNAFKFTDNGGTIAVTVQMYEGEISISISDNGKGIPSESQEKLFTDYFQVDEQDRNHIGSGIGLMLSKMIIEAHHGEISFVSRQAQNELPGQTTFSLKLKRGKSHFKPEHFENYKDQQQAVITTGPSDDKNRLKSAPIISSTTAIHNSTELIEHPKKGQTSVKETILIVEDNTKIREFITELMANQYKVVEGADGIEGWDIAVKTLPDLIICDVMMPKIDGLELCRRLKSDERTSHIPIIILTARSSHIHQVSGLETGADSYVTKPFSPELLLLTVRNLLTSRIVLRQRFLKYAHLEPAELTLNATDEAFMAKLLHYVDEHIADEDFGVSKLAQEIGMSRPVLYKKIRMLTDLSVNDFIKSIRLKKARQLFMQNRYTIYEVSYRVGFNDPKYFSREFKKQFGESPRNVMNQQLPDKDNL